MGSRGSGRGRRGRRLLEGRHFRVFSLAGGGDGRAGRDTDTKNLGRKLSGRVDVAGFPGSEAEEEEQEEVGGV